MQYIVEFEGWKVLAQRTAGIEQHEQVVGHGPFEKRPGAIGAHLTVGYGARLVWAALVVVVVLNALRLVTT